ncbi:MAG: IS1595 family transposase [Gammaproteobacteria bacterium]|nr:IS1595 family transposase [Gammaproteobacteria bacterium]
MAYKAPGKSHREGIDLVALMDMFPDEATATRWFESVVWPEGRCCGHCGAMNTTRVPNAKPMPYWCPDCRSYFSVRTGTAIERSKIPLRKWAIAIYLEMTSLKGVSSMKLHRDLGISQKSAWFMLHRIREAWMKEPQSGNGKMGGPVEVDETYMGGRRKNMSNAKRKALAGTGRGAVGKAAIVGVKDRETKQVRATVVQSTDRDTLHGFIGDHAEPGAKVYTDEAAAYRGLPGMDHESVKHSVAEYVRGKAHTNGIESFWAILKRAHTGTFHKMSPKHLERYVRQFAGKHNLRESDTVAQLAAVAGALVGRRLLYRDLTADNGLASGSRGS